MYHLYIGTKFGGFFGLLSISRFAPTHPAGHCQVKTPQNASMGGSFHRKGQKDWRNDALTLLAGWACFFTKKMWNVNLMIWIREIESLKTPRKVDIPKVPMDFKRNNLFESAHHFGALQPLVFLGVCQFIQPLQPAKQCPNTQGLQHLQTASTIPICDQKKSRNKNHGRPENLAKNFLLPDFLRQGAIIPN